MGAASLACLQAKSELEAVLRSRADRVGALEEAAEKAQALLADSEEEPKDDSASAAEVEALSQLLADAKARLEEVAKEQVLLKTVHDSKESYIWLPCSSSLMSRPAAHARGEEAGLLRMFGKQNRR